MHKPTLYALDFDGVLCDSALETAITGWKAAGTLWPEIPNTPAPQNIIDRFREVRPIIETGYEAILAVRLLFLGESVDGIFSDYAALNRKLMAEANVSVDDLKALFGTTRDRWIAADIDSWISMNPLFYGIADKLRRLQQSHPWYVITTKQERFVNLILNAHGIELAGENIYGLDRNLSKAEVLTRLVNKYPHHAIHFVEDRLPTLVKIAKQEQLAQVKLIFAEWGYNTEADKQAAATQGFSIEQLPRFLA